MNKKIIHNKNKGILFFITGLAGSGKTSIEKKIKKEISVIYGPTIEVSGDNFRKIFKFNKFTPKARKEYLMNYLVFAKLITDQKIIGITGTNGKSTTVKLISDMIIRWVSFFILRIFDYINSCCYVSTRSG